MSFSSRTCLPLLSRYSCSSRGWETCLCIFMLALIALTAGRSHKGLTSFGFACTVSPSLYLLQVRLLSLLFLGNLLCFFVTSHFPYVFSNPQVVDIRDIKQIDRGDIHGAASHMVGSLKQEDTGVRVATLEEPDIETCAVTVAHRSAAPIDRPATHLGKLGCH